MINDQIVKAFLKDPQNGGMLLKSSFRAFHEFFMYYTYKIAWDWQPFHEQIVKKLEDVVFGRAEKPNLVINICPRSGKSKMMEMFEAWCYLINPYSNILHTSYSDILVKQTSKAVRAVVQSPAFQAFSGGVPIRTDSAKAEFWQTEPQKGELGGAYRACTMEGAPTGFGAGVYGATSFSGLICVDDPNKGSSVTSRAELQATIDAYVNAIKSRKNDPKTPIVMIMQRLDPDDLTGYVLENEAEEWDLLKIQTIDEDKGVSLWESKFPYETMMRIKKQTPHFYYGQYQQEPIVIGGSVIQTEWFNYYNTDEFYPYMNLFAVADTAQKKNEANDFTVISLWGYTYNGHLHLIDRVRGKFDALELEQVFIATWDKWKTGIGDMVPYGLYVEDKSSGIGIIQTLKQKTTIPIIPIQRAAYKNDKGEMVKMDKYSRALTALPHITAGRVYLRNNPQDPISADLLAECAAFRADLLHKHDDFCFVAGTKIKTLFGEKNIEDMKKGDIVITPFGLRRVQEAKMTGIKDVIFNKTLGLKGTPDHKILTRTSGLDILCNIQNIEEVMKWNLKNLLIWKIKSLFSLTERNIVEWGERESISYLIQRRTKEEKSRKDCISPFGNTSIIKKFLRAFACITKTIIHLTITPTIWSVYHLSNTLKCTKKIVANGIRRKKQKSILRKFEILQRNGTEVLKEENGTENTQEKIWKEKKKQESAPIVEENLHIEESEILYMMDDGVQNAVIKYGQDYTENCEAERLPVFNLTVNGGVYFANDILVSNCDCLTDAINIAFGAENASSIFI